MYTSFRELEWSDFAPEIFLYTALEFAIAAEKILYTALEFATEAEKKLYTALDQSTAGYKNFSDAVTQFYYISRMQCLIQTSRVQRVHWQEDKKKWVQIKQNEF